jgi:tryptophanyl-tRNA synthetase
VLHIPVTEIRLQAADVGSAVDQTVPTGVAQHMRMRPERKLVARFSISSRIFELPQHAAENP